MAVQITLETPLADALAAAIQPKLVEVGWASEEDGSGLTEYVILMLVNGKTQEQIAVELSTEILSLPADDPSSLEFARWLFGQIEMLNAQLNGQAPAPVEASQPDAAGGEMDTDMGAADADPSEMNVYGSPNDDIKLNTNPRKTHRTQVNAKWQPPGRTREAHGRTNVARHGSIRRLDAAQGTRSERADQHPRSRTSQWPSRRRRHAWRPRQQPNGQQHPTWFRCWHG